MRRKTANQRSAQSSSVEEQNTVSDVFDQGYEGLEVSLEDLITDICSYELQPTQPRWPARMEAVDENWREARPHIFPIWECQAIPLETVCMGCLQMLLHQYDAQTVISHFCTPIATKR